jgi:hypothetical protein
VTPARRAHARFAAALTALVVALLGESLLGGKALGPADVLATTAAFGGPDHAAFVPANRLLTDPVLQFRPWLEWNRAQIRAGRLPRWNPLAGCGAPHLANAQAGVFDPFHLIAYVGPLPAAIAWVAAARLMVAGAGMYLLALRWGLGPWGRSLAGLAFPLSGFLVGWLLYPVASAAAWLPWVLLAADRLVERPSPRRAAALAGAVGASLLAGHVQTTAHVLLASAALVAWRLASRPRAECARALPPVLLGWIGGIGIGAVVVVPLAFYLARSPVWADRERTATPPLTLAAPRLLDAACTVAPYAWGSQRRGHPNLARALGVHNLNESAGGFVGLATALWLLPVAWSRRRSHPLVPFLLGLLAFGFAGAFEVPPVANLLRALPVVRVIDHRRLTLWVAFALAMLGGIGLDALHARGRAARLGMIAALIVAAGLVAVALAVGTAEPMLRERALAHYQKAALADPALDAATLAARATRQVDDLLRFVPRYALALAAQLAALAALAWRLRRDPRSLAWARPAVLGIVLLDLFTFGFGLNPALDPALDRPVPPAIAHLKQTLDPGDRALGVGAELLPNTLMRYGLADIRNYDSIESARTLAYFEPLYEPGPTRTCRRDITWAGVARAEPRLKAARVAAVVGATPPPDGLFDRVERAGAVWIGRWTLPPGPRIARDGDRMTVAPAPGHRGPLVVPEAFEPGWTATVAGEEARTHAVEDMFLGVDVPAGARVVALRYDPAEVRLGVALSLAAAALCVLAAALVPTRSSGRKTASGAWSRRKPRVRIETGEPGATLTSPANH